MGVRNTDGDLEVLDETGSQLRGVHRRPGIEIHDELSCSQIVMESLTLELSSAWKSTEGEGVL